jgi:hypothetical protein
MKIDWTKILTDLGLAGIIAYSLKILIESFFQKSIKYYEKQLELKQEAHRLEINKSLEAYKTELNLFNQRISSLNSKQLEILAELYEYIAEADMKMKIMAARIKNVTPDFEKEEEQRIINAGTAYDKFLSYYDKKRIFFSKESCKLVDTLLKEYHSVHWDYTFKRRWGVEDRQMALSAGKRIEEMTPKVLDALQDDFRQLLGVT